MEKIIKNADTFLHILEAAHSSRVSNWTAENLSKAMSWADHHQQIYTTYASREKVSNLLDIELKKLAYRNCILINLFSFRFLEFCQDFLLCMLQSNSCFDPDLLGTIPNPGRSMENTQIFNCIININKKITRDDGNYLTDVVGAICSTVQEAMNFQKTCPVVTTAPHRAITTLFTRVYNVKNRSRDLFIRCFVNGSDVVRSCMVEWLECFGSEIWSTVGVNDIVKCSQLNPGFCKLHVVYIMQLFELTSDYKTLYFFSKPCSEIADSSKSPQSNCKQLESELIFGSKSKDLVSNDKNYSLRILSEHLVILHATKCCNVVEELLRTLSKHPRFGALAQTYLNYLTPEIKR